MNKYCLNLALAIGALHLLSGCQLPAYQGEAHDVRRRPQEGGVVAMQRNFRPEDRARAEDTMKSVCAPNPFRVVEEGEMVTGQEVVSNTRETHRANSEHEVGSFLGIPVTSGDRGGKDAATSSTTKNLKEWQITYTCERAAPKKAAGKGERIKSIVVQ